MGPDRFSYPPIPTDLPESKPEVGVVDESIKNIPLIESQEIPESTKVVEDMPPLKVGGSDIELEPVNSAEQKPESLEESLLNNRNNYLENYRNWQKFKEKPKRSKIKNGEDRAEHRLEEDRLSDSLTEAHSEYKKILHLSFEKEWEEAREKFMKEFGVEPAAEYLDLIKADLIKKYVIEEADILEQAKVDGWPPKEKKLWQKALESYSSLPKTARFAISATLGTAFVATFSTAAVAGAVGIAGIGAFKMARSAIGYELGRGVSNLTNILFENAKKKDVAKHEKELSSVGDFWKISDKHQEFLETQKKINAWKKAEQVALGLAVGVGASNVMAGYENLAEHSLGLKTELPRVDGRLINPEPKSSFPGHSPEEQIKPDLGEPVPVPDAELNYEHPTVINPEAGHSVKVGGSQPEFHSDPTSEIVSDSSIETEVDRLTVRPKEGFWQPVSRELEFRINANPEKYGLSAEDLKDDSVVAHTVVRETNHILRSNHLLDSSGQMMIGRPGSVISLSDNGEVSISEGAKVYPKSFVENPSVELGDASVEVQSPRILTNPEGVVSSRGITNLESIKPTPNLNSIAGVENNFSNPHDEVLISNPHEIHGAGAVSEELVNQKPAWITPDLEAHPAFLEIEEGLTDVNNRINLEFFDQLPLSGQKDFSQFLENDGFINQRLSEYENYKEIIENGGLKLPSNEVVESLQEKLEEMKEVYAKTLEAKQNIISDLPNYDGKIKVGDFLGFLKQGESVNWNGGYHALAEKISTMDLKDNDLNLTLDEYLNDHITQNGLETPVATHIEVPSYLTSKLSEAATKVIEAHATIGLAKVELPVFVSDLQNSLEMGNKMSFADFQDKFINNKLFLDVKEDLAKICDNTEAKIKSLEESGLKVDSSVKDSLSEAKKLLTKFDELNYEQSKNWKDSLSDLGLDEETYLDKIVNAKDINGHHVVIDTGSVLDMPKNYTPSQIGKFVGLVDKVKELTEDLTPEELAEVRKLPVDQLIKQNIKL